MTNKQKNKHTYIHTYNMRGCFTDWSQNFCLYLKNYLHWYIRQDGGRMIFVQFGSRINNHRGHSNMFKTSWQSFGRGLSRSISLQKLGSERLWVKWGKVHIELLIVPICEKRERIAKVLLCRKCNTCGRDGPCSVCFENRVVHYPGSPLLNIHDYEEIFYKYCWAATVRTV